MVERSVKLKFCALTTRLHKMTALNNKILFIDLKLVGTTNVCNSVQSDNSILEFISIERDLYSLPFKVHYFRLKTAKNIESQLE